MTISIHYNRVILRDCEVKQFIQSIVRDQSGTDRMYSRFSITVAANLIDLTHAQDGQRGVSIDPGKLVFPTVERMQWLHTALQEDRQDFWMVIGGQENYTPDEEITLLAAAGKSDGTIPIHPADPGGPSFNRADIIDTENGPHCENVSIQQIFGGRSMRVQVTFKICRHLCDPDFQDIPPTDESDTLTPTEVLSNRWHLDESKDDNWITTRRLQGTLRTISAEFYAQNYRQFVVPPLLRGYKRVDQSFVSDATNTTLKYSITDRQVHAAPPPPCIKWEGTHTESTTGMAGRPAASLALKLTGPPGVDKRELIGVAGRIIQSRINSLGVLQKDPTQKSLETLLHHVRVIDRIEQPVIEIALDVRYTTRDSTSYIVRVEEMTRPLTDTLQIDGYHPLVNPVPLAYDSNRPAGVFACYLQNPCSVYHGMPQNKYQPPYFYRKGNDESQPPDAREYPEMGPLDDDYKNMEPSKGDKYDVYAAPYTAYEMSNSYAVDMGLMHLPLAVDPEATPSVWSALAQVHGGIATRTVEVSATRDGIHPVIPELRKTMVDPNGIEERLLHWTVVTRPQELTADEFSKRFGVAVMGVYAMTRPPTTTEKLRGGSLPIDADDPTATTIDLNEVSDDENKIMDTYQGTLASQAKRQRRLPPGGRPKRLQPPPDGITPKPQPGP